MDGYIGETKMFAGPYAPKNWLFCQGQTLTIAQYNSLYAIIGTTYGGDGISNFNLPDLRGRVPIGGGKGTNLTERTPGQNGGLEKVTLTTTTIPQHSHTVRCDTTSTGTQLTNTPQGNLPASFVVENNPNIGCYGLNTTGNPTMKPDMINNTGGNVPHENMPPWACINYIINTVGLWPPRD